MTEYSEGDLQFNVTNIHQADIDPPYDTDAENLAYYQAMCYEMLKLLDKMDLTLIESDSQLLYTAGIGGQIATVPVQFSEFSFEKWEKALGI